MLNDERQIDMKETETEKDYNIKLKFALNYIDLGLYPIPILPGTKRPAIKFANKPQMTPQEATAIWVQHPDWDIALRTVDHVVVDVDVHDTKNANGIKSLSPYWNAKYFPKTVWIAHTRSGGVHIYMMKPKGFEGYRQAIGFLPGVDFKSHINNYTIAPPSTGYTWADWDAYQKALPSCAKSTLLELIASEAEKKTEHHSVPGTAESKMDFTVKGKHGHSTNTLLAINSILHGLGDIGGRNDFLTKIVGTFLAIGVSYVDTYELVTMANARTANPLPQSEVDATFESIVKAHMSSADDTATADESNDEK